MQGTFKDDSQKKRTDALTKRLGTRSIVLVGMPGSGKSSVGRRLAQRIGLNFIDADITIQEAAGGMSITDIFAKHGEPEFRSLEARVIARLLESGPAVIATGGGAFMNADTRKLISERGISIWLNAEIEILLGRIKRKNDRPMLQVDDPEGVLKRLLSERRSTYAKATLTVTSCEAPHEIIVDTIVEALEKYLSSETAEAQL